MALLDVLNTFREVNSLLKGREEALTTARIFLWIGYPDTCSWLGEVVPK